MKTKQQYLHPEIELIRLDHSISLQLQSDADPMGEPDWDACNDSFTNDPLQEFKA
jgi:hypothetical protein